MFRDNLIQMRKIHQLTQEDVAEKVGVSRQAVAKYGTGSGQMQDSGGPVRGITRRSGKLRVQRQSGPWRSAQRKAPVRDGDRWGQRTDRDTGQGKKDIQYFRGGPACRIGRRDPGDGHHESAGFSVAGQHGHENTGRDVKSRLSRRRIVHLLFTKNRPDEGTHLAVSCCRYENLYSISAFTLC